MWRYFTKQGNKKLVNVLPDLIENYNTSKHRSINMTPTNASLKENESEV